LEELFALLCNIEAFGVLPPFESVDCFEGLPEPPFFEDISCESSKEVEDCFFLALRVARLVVEPVGFEDDASCDTDPAEVDDVCIIVSCDVATGIMMSEAKAVNFSKSALKCEEEEVKRGIKRFWPLE